MPTKSQRILSLLPGTFRAAAESSALLAVTDAFGGELQTAENALAAVMRAHWVDPADRGARQIDDLARIAALYGLAPRPDEGVEEFREHLKRYVRTFLEGTVTVQGILRVTAEALALTIDDTYDDLDTWWTRRRDGVVSVVADGTDAAELILGISSADLRGTDARAARAEGNSDLAAGVDLSAASKLRLKIDTDPVTEIDLAAGATNPAEVTLQELTDAINDALGVDAASHDGRLLTLTAPVAGAASRLEIQAGAGDAAPAVLGFAQRSYHGTQAEAARLIGQTDLAGTVDLTTERYLRLRLDDVVLAEVDCAGPAPATTTVDEIRDAINAALGFSFASHDGHHLILESTILGFNSSIILESAAAQDARQLLFGEGPLLARGKDQTPAEFRGRRELPPAIDLTAASRLRLRVDGGSPVTVDLAGADPATTTPSEILDAINGAFGFDLARLDGGFVILTSPTQGPASRLTFQKLPTDDATEAILGISARVFAGADPAPARLEGRALDDTVSVRTRRWLRLAVDGGETVAADLRAGVADPDDAEPTELAAALNNALGMPVATVLDDRLVLTSPTAGAASRLRIEPIERIRRRRFLTRAILRDEAARPLFGFVSRQARGGAATAATIQGTVSLALGVDLTQDRYLRLAVDGAAPFEIDCAGPRPRATTLDEVVAAINARTQADIGRDVATAAGRHLRLVSPGLGAASQLRLEPSQAADARQLLALDVGLRRGRDATGVRFVGTADLSLGIALPADAALGLAIDGAAALEVPLAAGGAGHYTLAQLVVAINLASSAQLASHDGRHLILTSPTLGATSQLEIVAPAGADVTAEVLGIPAPRAYQGRDAEPAEARSREDLPATLDLSQRRFLRVGADGALALVDLAAGAAEPTAVTPAEIADALGNATESGDLSASVAGARLILTSSTAGLESRVALEPATAGDARASLLGEAPNQAQGLAPAPAELVGEVPLRSIIDLGRRRWLRLAVDGGAPRDIDVAGASPERTVAVEVVAALNRELPGIASIGDDDRLRLTSPTTGPTSCLELLPRRTLELEEYPPVAMEVTHSVHHATLAVLRNAGAAPAPLDITVQTTRGAFGIAMSDLATGDGVRVLTELVAGDVLSVRRTTEGAITAEILDRDGATTPVADEELQVTGRDALKLRRGTSRLLYRECRVSRFDEAKFDQGRFAGGVCTEWGVFDASRFAADKDPTANPNPGPAVPVFAPKSLPTEATAELTARWHGHLPGRFRVHLPADLPEHFGGRFGTSRFGAEQPELYAGAVTEPEADPDQLITQVNQGKAGGSPSVLVHSPPEDGEVDPALVPRVPLGFEAAVMPFREPKFLTLGDADNPARIYLGEDGLDGFIRLDARHPGAWGNRIAITAKAAGPGRYDIQIAFAGAPFENARQAVLGDPLPAAAAQLLRPGPVGVLQAKAAGVEVEVHRDQTLLLAMQKET